VVPAAEQDYDGVEYADMVFAEIDWSEIDDHDPAQRSERKGTTEHDVATEWATEACQDPQRWVRDAGSRSGMTVKVTGWSSGADFLVTVVVAPKEFPPADRWWGATAWKANRTEVQKYEER
jgi:hypothetical protein